jgi:cell division protein FtsW
MTYTPHAFGRADRSRLGQWAWTVDAVLLTAVLTLIGAGVLFAFGNSPAAATRIPGIHDPLYFAWRQLGFALAGVAVLLAVSMLSPKGVRRLAFAVYVITIPIMGLLPLIGHSTKGADRWLQVGGFSLQPSEFMKPAVIVLAAWMFAEGQKDPKVPGVFVALIIWLVPVALLLRQPDIGQTFLISSAFLCAFIMAGSPWKWIVTGMAGGFGAGAIIYFTYGHVYERVHKFLAQGKADTLQIDKAMQAVASGGFLGKGAGEGVLKRQVPDVHTDFAYSGAAEDYGLIVPLVVIGAFALIVLRGLHKAMKLEDPFEQVAAGGLFVLVGQQACINIAVNLNLMPTKGMTLPFISYGGSSMLAMGLTLGMALALTRRRPGGFSFGRGQGARIS